MVRNLLLIIMTFLFSSCFVANYYEQAEHLAIVGVIDGVNNGWETYDLVYILDEDTVDVSWANYNEKNEHKRDGHLRIFLKIIVMLSSLLLICLLVVESL